MEPLEGRSSRHDRAGVEEGAVEQFYTAREAFTWRTRLAMMWRVDEWGLPSPELANVRFTTEVGFFGGVAYGAYHESAKVQRMFLEQNKYTMFQHPREAQKAMQDRVFLAMLQGGWRAGWRMGLLAFTFSAVAQSLTAVRNYVNPLDYGAAGAAMGALYKAGMGPRGMVGAGVGGALLGLQGGVLAWALQRLSGITVEERWHMDYLKIQEQNRQEEVRAAEKDARTQVVLKEQEEEEEDVGLKRVIVGLRRMLGERGLEEAAPPAPAPAPQPAPESSPGLEVVRGAGRL